MKRKYFGTDGIRGEANKELTVELALKLGYALGYYLKKKNPDKKKIMVIMGSDTRISGYMLRSALTAGLTALGIDIEFRCFTYSRSSLFNKKKESRCRNNDFSKS